MSIHVRNWEKFQHRDVVRAKQGRAPVWIKLYTELLSDEAFLELTEHRRLLLICLWLEYARTRARLPLDTRSLSRRLQLRVTTADLRALNDAGFLEYQPAESQPSASLEERRGEQTVRSNRVQDVAAPEVEAPNVIDLDARRPSGVVNGKPMRDVIGGVLDDLRARAP